MVVAKILLNSKNVDYLCFDNAKIMAQYCLDNKVVPYEVYENVKYIDDYLKKYNFYLNSDMYYNFKDKCKDDDKEIYAKWMITMDMSGRLIDTMLYGFTHEYKEESYTYAPAYNKYDDNMRYITVTVYLCVDANTTKDQVYNMAYKYLNNKVIKEIMNKQESS